MAVSLVSVRIQAPPIRFVAIGSLHRWNEQIGNIPGHQKV